MKAVPSRRRPGFTLVELLTVIAIIVLLISILIPAVQTARTQAKQAASTALLKSLGSGCEMFKGDFNRYPQSRGYNPFEGSPIELFGAQWLALQLVGPDTRGFVKPDLKNDSNNDGVINEVDWLDWYSLDPSREYTRMGPYADVDAKQIRSVARIREENPRMAVPGLLVSDGNGGSGGSSDWNNERIPFFVDAWEYPVVYYAANPQVDEPFTTGTPGGGDLVVGRYDRADNACFTGSDDSNGRYPVDTPGWDLTETAPDPAIYMHPLGEFQYIEDQTSRPVPKTFEGFVYNEQTYESTRVGSDGRIWPHNPDSFLLISAGSDGILGTTDDITNFER